MTDDRERVEKLVYALRRIEADAEGALAHGGGLRKALTSIRDQAGQAAAEAARDIGMAPYGGGSAPR
ncbi:MAG TPA: hypothetical protein VF502_05035 [Stellaceae bacterium]